MLFFWLNQTFAQEKLSLEDAIKLMLNNNYSIQIAKNDAEASSLQNSLGNAGMLPTINANALQDNQNLNTKQKFLNGTENTRNGAANNSFNAALELNWTLFDGTKMFITKNKLSNLQHIQELKLKQQVELNLEKLIKSYYSVLLETEKVNVNAQQFKVSEDRVNFSKQRFEAGKFSKNEYLISLVDRNTDEVKWLESKQSLLNSQILLNQIMAVDLNKTYILTDSLTIEKATEDIALLSNTSLKLMEAQKINTRLELKETQAQRWPLLQFRSGYLYNTLNSQAGFLQSATNNGLHYGASASVNLFNGFNLKNNIAVSKIKLKNIEAAYLDSMQKIQANIILLNTRSLSLANIIAKEEENLKFAEESYTLSNEQFIAGKITAIELRLIQQNFEQSKLRYLQAKFDYKLNQTELKRLSGKLLNPY